MWPFGSKKSLEGAGLLRGYTDWHCHLLPGVDDGVGTQEETLEIFRLYESLGVARVYLTPHVMEDMPNTPDDLRGRFAELQKAYSEAGGKIELRLAAENMLDCLFEDRFDKGEVLTLNGERLLVETSYFTPPMNFHSLLEHIKSKGYFPVLAHPERYIYMDETEYKTLKGMGILFQLNWYSPVGIYGPEAKKKSEWLLSRGYYDLSGSDTHRLRILQSALSHKALRGATLEGMEALMRAKDE